MDAYCTIVTPDYIQMAVTLHRSIARFGGCTLEVLVTGETSMDEPTTGWPGGVRVTQLSALVDGPLLKSILDKYQDDPDALRWSLKSMWMRHLLLERGYEQIIFVDPDLFFFSDPKFLFDELDHGTVLLSPHWRSADPHEDPMNFELNFRDGLFNGGFLGATRDGVPILEWHAGACLYACERSPERGLFLDQKYLDLIPVYFQGVRILQHRGCNVASWNRVECRREIVEGKVMVNGKYPVVFIHFTRSTIRDIADGKDPLLDPLLKEYLNALTEHDPALAAVAVHTKRARTPGLMQRISAGLKPHAKRR